MAYYLIKFNGGTHANDELYYTAIAKGERAFMKMLASKTVVGKELLDQILYPVTGEQQEQCLEYNPTLQDFEDFFKHLNITPKEVIAQAKVGECPAIPGAAIITIDARLVPELFKYRQVTFFKARDYKEAEKYKMLPKMAAVKICGCIYIAFNTVDVRIDKPIIVTLKG